MNKIVRFLKVGDTVYYNVSPTRHLEFTANEHGEFFTIEEPVFDVEKMHEYAKDTVIWLEKEIVSKKFQEAGYFSIGDAVFYKNKDPKAKELLEWYEEFDAKVWNWIENELPAKTNEELLEIDLKELVEGFANE